MTDQMQGLCCCCLFLSISSLLLKIPLSLVLMRTVVCELTVFFFSSDGPSILSPGLAMLKVSPGGAVGCA